CGIGNRDGCGIVEFNAADVLVQHLRYLVQHGARVTVSLTGSAYVDEVLHSFLPALLITFASSSTSTSFSMPLACCSKPLRMFTSASHSFWWYAVCISW